MHAYAYLIIHTIGHLVLHCLGTVNLPDSESPKQSAKDAFFNMSCILPTRKTYSLSVGSIRQNFCFAVQNYAKYLRYANFFQIFMKKICTFDADLLFLWSITDSKGMVDELIPLLFYYFPMTVTFSISTDYNPFLDKIYRYSFYCSF